MEINVDIKVSNVYLSNFIPVVIKPQRTELKKPHVINRCKVNISASFILIVHSRPNVH